MEISADAPEKVIAQFERALKQLRESRSYSLQRHKPRLMSAVHRLADSEGGLRYLYSRIGEMQEAGLFADSSWEDPRSLVPTLVGGTLKAGGEAANFEILSELRLLALAREQTSLDGYSAEEARTFLQKVLANNLEFLFPEGTEETRSVPSEQWVKIRQLFQLLVQEIPLTGIKDNLLEEVEMICAQRPIITDRARRILTFVRQELDLTDTSETDRRLQELVDAIYLPTSYLREHPDCRPEEYRAFLEEAEPEMLKKECREMGEVLSSTGLSSAWHSQMLHAVAGEPSLLKEALALNQAGKAELKEHTEFTRELVEKVVTPSTFRCIYGLGRLLERGLLSHQPVRSGLKRLLHLELHPVVRENILRSTLAAKSNDPDPSALLTADALSVLGQPLGVGQGWNPTCQSARGISIWSQHAPGKLLGMVVTAASENNLTMRFEGTDLNSSEQLQGLAKELDFHLDMVSIVLVPHLDRLYNEMMRRCGLRTEDGHKWVNPAMYGQWIPSGFASAYDLATKTISGYESFLRTFYATHHPDYNGGHDLAYPNPVGIFITSSSGKLLGFHAVSILRVSRHDGQVRVYFRNPNNEGRQTWGPGLEPTVTGHGEEHGESSLPFPQFASRIYAFHYMTSGVHEPEAVPERELRPVIENARSSWGESYTWSD